MQQQTLQRAPFKVFVCNKVELTQFSTEITFFSYNTLPGY